MDLCVSSIVMVGGSFVGAGAGGVGDGASTAAAGTWRSLLLAVPRLLLLFFRWQALRLGGTSLLGDLLLSQPLVVLVLSLQPLVVLLSTLLQPLVLVVLAF